MKPNIIKLNAYEDDRGVNRILFDDSVASQLPSDFRNVQINQAFSTKAYTLRGLHYQLPPFSQAKLCYCLSGAVYNVALNLETGEEYGEELRPGTTMYIPRGYAHGYITLEDNVLFQWCVDNDFAPDDARILHYSSVSYWPAEPVIICEKDRNGENWPG